MKRGTFRALLRPHGLVILALSLLSAGLLVYVFTTDSHNTPIAYGTYLLSAYALVVAVIWLAEGVMRLLRRIPIVQKWLGDQRLRIVTSLTMSLVINLAYVVWKMVMGCLYGSAWMLAAAGYYLVLSGTRFLLLRREQMERHREDPVERRIHQLKSYRFCGWMLLLLSVAVHAIVFLAISQMQRVQYPGTLIYGIAAYTFFNLALSITQFVKFFHIENPVFSAAKRLNMAKTLFSVFMLQIAMFTRFGSENVAFEVTMDIIAGTVVFVLIFGLALGMILRAGRALRAVQA